MKASIQALANRIDALSLRERGAVMLMVVAVLVFLWSQLLMAPLNTMQLAKQQEIAALQSRLGELNSTITAILTDQSGESKTAKEQQMARLQDEIARLDEQLGELTAELLEPREMAKLLEAVLEKNTRLKLVEMRNLPAEALLTVDDAALSERANVYRHGLSITVEGSYLATLDYVRALEQLPWRFYWDSLELRTEKYPVNRTTIVVYTLSLQEGMLGV